VLAPLIAGQAFGGHHAPGCGEVSPLHEGTGIAFGGKIALPLRPQAMDKEAEARTDIALVGLLGRATRGAEARRPGQREQIEVKVARCPATDLTRGETAARGHHDNGREQETDHGRAILQAGA